MKQMSIFSASAHQRISAFKKLIKQGTMILGLGALSFVSANAQTGWYVNAAAVQVTPDDIGIGLPINTVPNSKLKIASGFIQSGGYNPIVIFGQIPDPPAPCTVVGKPALSINWEPMNQPANGYYPVLACSNESTIVRPNALEIYGVKTLFNGSNQINYALQVDHAGRTGVGGIVNNGYKFNVKGNSILNGNVQMTQKFRINSNANLSTGLWNNIDFPYVFSVDNGDSRFLGKVQIGDLKRDYIVDPNCILSVNGDMYAKRIVVQTAGWADNVFEEEYELKSIQDVEKFIKINKHLPDMPSQATIINKGIDMAEMQKMQQAKIEELTLYIINLQREVNLLKSKN